MNVRIVVDILISERTNMIGDYAGLSLYHYAHYFMNDGVSMKHSSDLSQQYKLRLN